MQTRISVSLSLTLFYVLAESAPRPAGLGTLQFDRLDTDIDDLKYEIEEEDLDDYSKLLDDIDVTTKPPKPNVKATGFKKKSTENNGAKSKHTVADLKKFFKTAGLFDEGSYDDADAYALAEALAASAVGVQGNEDRKYRKGTKTRGFHKVHHKDEYKKDKVFFEDDVTNGTLKKIGAKGRGIRVGAGAEVNKGHKNHSRQQGIYGKQGYSDEGIFDKEFNRYKDSQGFDASFSNER